MATKTISVRIEAWETLRTARREPGESFSDVILRATWPKAAFTAAELLRRAAERGPILPASMLATIARAKKKSAAVPPEDKWRRG